MRFILLVVIIFLAALNAANTALAANTLAINGTVSGDVGRIEFKFDEKNRFKANVDGQTLVVTFENPVEASLFGLLTSLRDFIGRASFTADKKQILADLKKPCQAVVTDVGETSIIELRPKSTTKPSARKEEPEAKEEITTARTAEEPIPPMISDIYQKSPEAAKNSAKDVVNVEFSPLDGHAEVRFKWPRKVEYRIFHKPDSLLIEFDDSAPSMPPATKGEMEKYIKSVANRSLDGHLIYTFTFPTKSAFAHRKEGNDVVLDILPVDKVQQAKKEEPSPAAPAEKTLSEKPAAKPASTATTAATSSVEVSTLPASPQQADNNNKAISPVHKIVDGTEIISFPWNKPVAAAMFIRDRQGWIVFDTATKTNISQLMRSNSDFIENVNAAEASNATIFSFRLKKKTKAHMLKKGNEWQFVIAAPNSSIAPVVEKKPSDNGKVAFIAVRQPSNPVIINDDVTGQIVRLVPLPDDGISNDKQRGFVDFNLLPSGQGIAVEILNDQLQISVDKNGIILGTERGLNISRKEPAPAVNAQPPPHIEEAKNITAKPAEPPAPAPIEEKKPLPQNPPKQSPTSVFLTTTGNSFLPYELWKTPDGADFHGVMIMLNHELMDSKAEELDSPRMRTARFMMAEGMYPEALSIISIIKDHNPDYITANHLSALSGIAHFMRDDFKEALEDFSRPELAKIPEAELWKKAIQANAKDSVTPVDINEDSLNLITEYPPEVKQKLLFMLVDRFIRDRNFQAAKNFLGHIAKDATEEVLQEKIDIYRGRIAMALNDYKNAEAIFAALQNSAQRKVSTQASTSLVELNIMQNKIKPEESIKRLEPLLIKWRGDEVELDVMRILSQLYLENGQYREGLEMLRDLIANFPDSETAAQAAKLMNTTFVDLFTNGKADPMTPIDALSIYYEFRELTPLNRDGDVMIQKLADRMVQVDLLERAAALLSHQIRYRISGDERARVATRLAYIHMRNNEPEKAIEVLESTEKESADLADEAKEIRHHLYAEALIKLKRYEEAIPVLDGDQSPTGQRLAIEAFWNAKDWKRAESYIKAILAENPPPPSSPLSIRTAEQIMRLALVYQFTNNNKGLAETRTKYEKMMQATPYAESFKLVTAPISKINHLNIETTDGLMKQFGSVMKELDSKVADSGLSKAIP